MEIEMKDELQVQIDKVAEVAERLERLISRQGMMAADGEASLERLVAMVEATGDGRREAELTARLAEAERTIAELRASVPVAASHSARRTLPVSLVAKQENGVDYGALDAALGSLSPEQRIAVKSQLLRAGLV